MKQCSVEGCEARVYAKTWCRAHYARWTRHGSTDNVKPVLATSCRIGECPKPVIAKALCAMHYQRLLKTGDARGEAVEMLKDVYWETRFDRMIVTDGICPQMWGGKVNLNGYGQFHFTPTDHQEGRSTLVHRIQWERANGPIPDGLQIDHLCHSQSYCRGGFSCPHRRCLTVAHLEVVTLAENMWRSRKLTCRRGHPYDDADVLVRPDSYRRRCAACSRQSVDRRRGSHPNIT